MLSSRFSKGQYSRPLKSRICFQRLGLISSISSGGEKKTSEADFNPTDLSSSQRSASSSNTIEAFPTAKVHSCVASGIDRWKRIGTYKSVLERSERKLIRSERRGTFQGRTRTIRN